MLVDHILLLFRFALLLATLGVFFYTVRSSLREIGGTTLKPEERGEGWLEIVHAPRDPMVRLGDRIWLLAETTIGREAGNTVVLGDPGVSPYHAVLLWNPHGWAVQDRGSMNGTWVNGVKVAGTGALQFGDTLVIGDIELRLQRRAWWQRWW